VQFDARTGDWVKPAPAWDPEAAKPWRKALFWHILLGLDFALLAAFFGASAWDAPQGKQVAIEFTPELLILNSLLIFLFVGLIPFLWVVGTRVGGLHGAMHYLRLERPWPAIGRGLVLGLALLVALIALAAILDALDIKPENPQGDALARASTLTVALVVSLAAAFGEEVLFRGVLLKWLGVWPQAILFGLVHLDYGTPMQVIVPLLLGALFGYAMKRGERLWVPIAAHFLFNFVQLTAAALLPETVAP
jgi:membrane protease YdiL (CAAX protease family)